MYETTTFLYSRMERDGTWTVVGAVFVIMERSNVLNKCVGKIYLVLGVIN